MSFRPHRSSKYNPVYAWKLGDKALTGKQKHLLLQEANDLNGHRCVFLT